MVVDGSRLEASGEEFAAWLTSPDFEARLFSYFPCADPPTGDVVAIVVEEKEGGGGAKEKAAERKEEEGGSNTSSSSPLSPSSPPTSPSTPNAPILAASPPLSPLGHRKESLECMDDDETDLEQEAELEASCQEVFAEIARLEAGAGGLDVEAMVASGYLPKEALPLADSSPSSEEKGKSSLGDDNDDDDDDDDDAFAFALRAAQNCLPPSPPKHAPG